jgi:hypothetical protein
MATNSDFSLYSKEDAVITESLAPPVAIGGWSVEFRMQRYFGDFQSGGLLKSCSSGYYGVSGIAIANSGQGVFTITLNSADTSGLPFGNYAYTIERTDPGQKTTLSLGYALIGPDIG